MSSRLVLSLVAVVLLSAYTSASEPTKFTGTVKPVPQKHYRGSPENGYPVTKINVKVGDQVKEGDIVIELDPAVLPLNLRKAQIGVAEAEIKMLLAKKKGREKVLARFERLHKTSAASTEDMENAQECVNCLNAEITRAEAALKAAQVAYEQADFIHTNYEIMKSPITGEVVRINCALGQCGRAQMEQVIWIEIIDYSDVEIHFSVPLKIAKTLKKGSSVTISQDGKTWKSKVSTVTKLADDNGNIPVIIEMPNPVKELVCGTEVNVSIE